MTKPEMQQEIDRLRAQVDTLMAVLGAKNPMPNIEPYRYGQYPDTGVRHLLDPPWYVTSAASPNVRFDHGAVTALGFHEVSNH